MKILFTARNTVLGTAIRYMTKEPVSHVAIQVNDLVLHSTLFGPEVRGAGYFHKHNRTILSIDLPDETIGPGYILDKYDHKAYDYMCLVYLGIRYATLRYLGIKLPKVNLWNMSGMYTCTELVTELLFEKPDSMITPYGLYLKLKERSK